MAKFEQEISRLLAENNAILKENTRILKLIEDHLGKIRYYNTKE